MSFVRLDIRMKADTWREIHNVKIMIASHGFHIAREYTTPTSTTERHMKMRLPDVDLIMKAIAH